MNSTSEIIEDLTNAGALATITATPVVAPFTVPEVVAVISTSETYPTLQADVVDTLAKVRALPSYIDLTRDRAMVLADAKALTVTDAATYTRADELAVKLAEIEDRCNAWWEPLTSFGFRFHRWLTARRSVDATEPNTERARLLKEAGAWRAEQLRLEAERAAAVALEEKRKADAVAAEQAAAAEAQGMPELAEAIVAEAIATPAPVVQLASAVPTGGSMSHGKDFEITVVNPALVPREYMVPDEKRILKVVKAMDGKIKIPGVVIKPKDTTKGRRRAS